MLGGLQAHYQATRKMSQSARITAKGKKKGRTAPSGVSPSLPPPSLGSSTPINVPSYASGAQALFNVILARQQAQEKNTLCGSMRQGKKGQGQSLIGKVM